MPPRYAYWTILAGGLPTAFRAAAREDLLPTLRRIAATHPDAELKWFARGRLWSSPDEAREAPRARPAGRGPAWRPGGEHRDPRQAFKDAKKARNAARRQQRFDRKQEKAGGGKPPAGAAGRTKHGSAFRPQRHGSTPRPQGQGAGSPPTRQQGPRPRRRAPGGPPRGPAGPGRGRKGGSRR